jgi:hypothetical protein
VALLTDDRGDEMSAEDLVNDRVVAVLAQRIHLATNFVVNLKIRRNLEFIRDVIFPEHKRVLKLKTRKQNGGKTYSILRAK